MNEKQPAAKQLISKNIQLNYRIPPIVPEHNIQTE